MPREATPTKATIFSYQVGFGDCFLLRFDYPGGERRHVLIDFGTTGLPQGVADGHMLTIAEDIREKCGGKLDVVVATHRHADHISGFATRRDGKGSGDIIRALDPEVVLQPWTEAPDAPEDGESFTGDDPKATNDRRRQLAGIQQASGYVLQLLGGSALARISPALRRQLAFIGQDNLPNASAVENLMGMGRERVYAFHGSDPKLAAALPGVDTLVLGPPTLAQSRAIKAERRTDPDEFWHLGLAGLDAERRITEQQEELFPGHPTRRATKLPRQARWFAHRVDLARGEQLLSLVRALDKQMNNTSLILLFEAGDSKLLFPGDAQIENWDYALAKPEIADRLRGVDVYKVGHHGSLNATPKSLWAGFAKRRKGPGAKPLKSVLSTMPDKHGHADSDTEVPRETLVKALDAETELHATHRMSPSQLYQEVSIELRGRAAEDGAAGLARGPAARRARPAGRPRRRRTA